MGDGPVFTVKLPLTARPHFIRFSRFILYDSILSG